MNNKKKTIKDIAKLAGVSKGTVDRVLHKRGKVSKDALEKVEKVLKEIEYHPNPIARNLKENKLYKICVLIPDDKIDAFWTPAHEGIYEAQQEFVMFGLVVEKYLYHPYKKEDFYEKSNQALDASPDVLLITPLFKEESYKIIDTCKEKNIRIALFNNYLNTLNKEVFIGQNLPQSGKIAADLFDKTVLPNSKIGIVHIDIEPHVLLKECGFKSYFKEKNSNHIILDGISFTSDNQVNFEKQFREYLVTNSDLSALFVTNSKAHMLVDILNEVTENCAIIGYDLVHQNIDFLKQGKIDFLIHQRPKEQTYLSISYFAEFFLFGKDVPLKNLLPIDIVTSENVDYYIN
ncbi:LacI family DNA-binding transcriptional regulator [Zobellia nedashkovskayae]|uniref:LacI family DNA-binding transcriptional regulator n=1 Tax=Zobellia nedashkovskayae TaxID=2779510 RepID=UPI00188C33E2|nr:LacI family DNA-binding transcriptional regulator [Zobellia nedashkovskayae]